MKLQVGTDAQPFIRENNDILQVFIYNKTGVTVYLGRQRDDATPDSGIPIPPATFIPPFLWHGELWIASDAPGGIVVYEFSRPLDWASFGGEFDSVSNPQLLPCGDQLSMSDIYRNARVSRLPKMATK